MDPFFIERQMFEKLAEIDYSLQRIRVQLSKKTLERAQQLNVQLNKDLADRCLQYLEKVGKQNHHTCKFCSKVFNDGRKLGGHVSRAHKKQLEGPGIKIQEEFQNSKKEGIKVEIQSPDSPKSKNEMKKQKRLKKNKQNRFPVSIMQSNEGQRPAVKRSSFSRYQDQKNRTIADFSYSDMRTRTRNRYQELDQQSQSKQSIPKEIVFEKNSVKQKAL